MNNTYEMPSSGIKEILDKIDRFIVNMETFSKSYSNYSYEILLNNNNNDLWSAKIKITNGKQEGNRIPDSAI